MLLRGMNKKKAYYFSSALAYRRNVSVHVIKTSSKSEIRSVKTKRPATYV